MCIANLTGTRLSSELVGVTISSDIADLRMRRHGHDLLQYDLDTPTTEQFRQDIRGTSPFADLEDRDHVCIHPSHRLFLARDPLAASRMEARPRPARTPRSMAHALSGRLRLGHRPLRGRWGTHRRRWLNGNQSACRTRCGLSAAVRRDGSPASAPRTPQCPPTACRAGGTRRSATAPPDRRSAATPVGPSCRAGCRSASR